jgi:hypothetical protein
MDRSALNTRVTKRRPFNRMLVLVNKRIKVPMSHEDYIAKEEERQEYKGTKYYHS